MALQKLDTKNFSEVEVAAREIANSVSDLKMLVSAGRTAACANWIGEGRDEFENLSYVIEQQMKDISDEFWDVYETLVNAESAFIEADNAVATEIEAALES